LLLAQLATSVRLHSAYRDEAQNRRDRYNAGLQRDNGRLTLVACPGSKNFLEAAAEAKQQNPTRTGE